MRIARLINVAAGVGLPLRPSVHLGAVLLGVAVVAGCGSDSGAGQPGPPAASPASPSSATSPAASAATTAAPPASASVPPTADPSAQVVELTYQAGQVSGVSGRVEIALGSDVVLRVSSDVSDELHLHGYDLKTDLSAGVPGELRFPADIPGIFELELEQTGKQLTRLQVR